MEYYQLTATTTSPTTTTTTTAATIAVAAETDKQHPRADEFQATCGRCVKVSSKVSDATVSTTKCDAVAQFVAVCTGPWGLADWPWGPVSMWWPTLSDEMAESCVNGAVHHGRKPAQQSSHSSRANLLRVRQFPVSKTIAADL